MKEEDYKRLIELLINAVNNRTRQRNYFRLYCQLLAGNITRKNFDNEINNNENDYVISNNTAYAENDIELISELKGKILDFDCEFIDDIEDLFSLKILK